MTNLEKFVKEYGELVKKYDVDFVAYPLFVPTDKGEFKIVCRTQPIDMKEWNKSQLDKAFISK